MKTHLIRRVWNYIGLGAMLLGYASGQTSGYSPASGSQPSAAVFGAVLDASGAVIAGASVTLGSGNRDLLETITDARGEFRFGAVAPGKYELRAAYPGFKVQGTRLLVGTRPPAAVRIVLAIADHYETVKVNGQAGSLSTESSENLDVIRLDPRQLEEMPILDRDVIGLISRLLDPSSMGSGGPSVIVDGLPSSERNIPLSEIEEIRFNKNPYSAEFARPGRGRIEIITKSGSSSYHGSLNFGFRDYRLDARNAFAVKRPPEERRQFEANLSGPIHRTKKNTFSVTFSRSQDDLEPSVYALGLTGPIRENAAHEVISTSVSAQYTRRMGGNALSFRYADFEWSNRGQGAGGFVLPEAALNSTMRYHQLYSSYRATISPKLVDEFLVRVRTEETSAESVRPGVPKIVVIDAFTAGGAQVDDRGTDNRIELTDTLSWSRGRHFLKTGVNLPVFGRFGSTDRSNSGGTFYFSSLNSYAQDKPFSFLQQTGAGHLVFWQKQVGGFVQDEISLRRNLKAALGLRYDWQNYGSDGRNLAPRLSLAFAPGKGQKMVFRAGAGFFYDTLSQEIINGVLRLDGTRLRQIQLLNPGYPDPFLTGPSFAALPPSLARFSPKLRSPYILQYSFGIDRQLRKSLSFTATYTGTRGVGLYRSRDVNAPLPPFYLSPPDASIGVLRQVESSGGSKDHTVVAALRGNMTRFFTGVVSYEWGRRMNDTNGPASFPADNWNPQAEWSRASSDARNFVYLYGTVNAGKYFKFGAIFSAISGNPYTMTTGLDSYHDGMTNARPPGVPRNSLHGTGTATLDLRWSREFPVHGGNKERLRFGIAVDAFNLFNRVNYKSFVGNLSSPFFGAPVSASPARRTQVSLAAKF
jgi:Carboxypeptidase regulatory-like domain